MKCTVSHRDTALSKRANLETFNGKFERETAMNGPFDSTVRFEFPFPGVVF